MENLTMIIDFYEFTMGQTYFDKGEIDKIAYFDVFFRKNPFNGGYTISGGLDNIISYIQNFHLSKEDILYLKNTNSFSDEYLEYLQNLRFTGDIYAVPDGTVIFPNEPIITVKAPIIEAQLIETTLLLYFNSNSLYTTASKRIVNAAEGKKVMEFGARRARGDISSLEVAKCAFISGCIGTSNTLAAMKYGIPALGTMTHSLVCDSDNEYQAFLDFAKSNPNNCMFLVDTYDTLKSGIPNAIKVAKEYLIPNNLKFKGIRIDSGDLAYLSKKARKMLDEAGFLDAKICLSNSLNEESIKRLLAEDTCVDSFGVGDNITAANDRIGGVYKLSATEEDGIITPKIKISDSKIKTTNPHYKKVYRFYDQNTGFALGDVITIYDEEIPEDLYTLINPTDEYRQKTLKNYYVRELQVPIFINGKLVYRVPSIFESQKYCEKEFATMYPEIKRTSNPHVYYVDLSKRLLELKKDLIQESIRKRIR
ncbi:MAG: nicotinate phosphoribosyltransferase [Bacilli bacterium]